MISVIGEWIIYGVGAFLGFKLLRWLWNEQPWILITLAILLVGSRVWGKGGKTADTPAQTATQTTPSPILSEDAQYRPYTNTGVCQNLTEDACVVVIFLDDTESEWTEYAVGWFLENKVEPGLMFIEKEGAEYGFNLDMTYYYHTGVKLPYSAPGTWEEFGDLNDLQRDTAAQLGFASDQEMLTYHREQTGKEQIVYMFCLYKPGRAFAHSSGNTATTGIEFTVIYSESSYGRIVNYRTIFHEILHVFGARDYYSENGERVNREKLAFQLCPTDIMLIEDPERLMDVGRYTAYCIGWLEEMPAEYNTPDWWS